MKDINHIIDSLMIKIKKDPEPPYPCKPGCRNGWRAIPDGDDVDFIECEEEGCQYHSQGAK